MQRQALLLTLPLLVAAGPQPEGHQASLGVGYSDFTELRLWYSAQEVVVTGDYRYTAANHVVVSGELSTAIGQRTYLDGIKVPWRSDFAGMAALRVGYERQYFGAETGLAFWLDPTEIGPLVSTAFWAGHPKLHLWTRRNPGTLIGDVYTMRWGFGMGVQTDKAHVELGRWNTDFWGYNLFSFKIEGKVNEALWVGVNGRYMPVHDFDRHETRVVLALRATPALWSELQR